MFILSDVKTHGNIYTWISGTRASSSRLSLSPESNIFHCFLKLGLFLLQILWGKNWRVGVSLLQTEISFQLSAESWFDTPSSQSMKNSSIHCASPRSFQGLGYLFLVVYTFLFEWLEVRRTQRTHRTCSKLRKRRTHRALCCCSNHS